MDPSIISLLSDDEGDGEDDENNDVLGLHQHKSSSPTEIILIDDSDDDQDTLHQLVHTNSISNTKTNTYNFKVDENHEDDVHDDFDMNELCSFSSMQPSKKRSRVTKKTENIAKKTSNKTISSSSNSSVKNFEDEGGQGEEGVDDGFDMSELCSFSSMQTVKKKKSRVTKKIESSGPAHCPPTTPVRLIEWECKMCTFHNPNASVGCEMCGTLNPQKGPYIAPKVVTTNKAKKKETSKTSIGTNSSNKKSKDKRNSISSQSLESNSSNQTLEFSPEMYHLNNMASTYSLPTFSYDRPRGFQSCDLSSNHRKKTNKSEKNNKYSQDNEKEKNVEKKPSSNEDDGQPPPMCNHGDPSVLKRQIKPGKNKGRQFYTCAAYQIDPNMSCGFFEWKDEEDNEKNDDKDISNVKGSENGKSKSVSKKKKTRLNYYDSADSTMEPLDMVEHGGGGVMLWEGAGTVTFG